MSTSHLPRQKNKVDRWLSILILSGLLMAGFSNARGVSAAPAGQVIYVDSSAAGSNDGSSWQNAYTSLQLALTAAVSSDQIWVAEGNYIPTALSLPGDPRSATFALKAGVSVYGGFAGNETARAQRDWRLHPTILSGDLSSNDSGLFILDDPSFAENSYHVVTAQGLSQTTRLDGFIIQGGNANVISPTTNFYAGGGMYVNSGSPSFANLILFNNNAIQGGGQYNNSSNSLMVNCAYIGNHADFGGGTRNYYSNPTIVNALYSGNEGRYRAGGIYNTESRPVLINSTLAYNSDTYGANSILSDNNSVLLLKNSIIWGNGLQQIAIETSSTAGLEYSLSQDGCTGFTCGSGMLSENPLFIDADGVDNVTGTLDDNLRLVSSSRALDAGANALVYQDALDINEDGNMAEKTPQDLAGAVRFWDELIADVGAGTPPIVDMGAYESTTSVAPTTYYLYMPMVLK